MRIGIYGGTFDPIHVGHVRAAEAAVKALELEQLLLIPAGIPPHKQLPEESAPAQHRLAMTTLAAEQIQQDTGVSAQALDLELSREGVNYTCDTLAALREQYPEDELWLLMGTDMFFSFQQWKQPQEIVKRAHLAVFRRYGEDLQRDFGQQARLICDTFGPTEIRILDLPQITELSSTQLRQQLQNGQGAEGLLPQIYGYILRHGLYGTKADLKNLSLDELRYVALSFLKAKRIPHVLGTEQAAAELAHRYGVDEEIARRAALLHDCAKRLDRGQQLETAERYGLPVDELEREETGLLHAKNGAAIARDLLGVDDTIYWAIYWHSTGKAGMNDLEKIIYIADYIEPTRNFPEVEKLRQAAARSLDEGLYAGLANTLEDTLRRGKKVHEKSREAMTYLEEHNPQAIKKGQ